MNCVGNRVEIKGPADLIGIGFAAICCGLVDYAQGIQIEAGAAKWSRPKVCSYPKGGTFTTNIHSKNECLLKPETVIRSTESPISCRCCYTPFILKVYLCLNS